MSGVKNNQNKLLVYLGIIIFSCAEQYSDANSPDDICGIDTTFVLPLPAIDIARYSDCRYILAGIYGTEILDELGNILPSWENNRSRVPATRGFNPTSDGGFLTTYIDFVSKSSPPDIPGTGWSWSIPAYQAPHYINDAIETTNGDYIAVGWISGDPGTAGHSQKGQAFIAKLSEGGIFQWIKRFGLLNTPKDTFWEVVEADDGGFVAVGSKLEAREFFFYDHFWLLKIDADGNQVWSREIGTNDRYDMAFDVIKLPDGGFAATGMSTINTNGVGAMRVVRISENGNIIWDKKAGGDGYQDMGHALALNQNEDVLMVAGMKQPSTGDSKIKLWGYNPETGDRLFTRNTIDREYGLSASGVVAAYDNGFVITSTTLMKTDSLGRF
tara:strand:+ start:162 stop:1313 length:1152 start_codon:yes stop_codon:yes gene_type:complete